MSTTTWRRSLITFSGGPGKPKSSDSGGSTCASTKLKEIDGSVPPEVDRAD